MFKGFFESSSCQEGSEFLKSIYRRTGKDRFPIKCQWEITCRCNFKCEMCYTDCFNSSVKIKEEIETAAILNILDQMHHAGVLELILTGGEPLAHPDFETIYIQAIQLGFITTVYSNGSLISERTIELWKKFPLYRIEISVYGFTPQTFDSVTRQKGSYEKTMRGIGLCLTHHLPLTLKVTATRSNQHEIPRMLGWIRESKVPYRLATLLRNDLDGKSQKIHEIDEVFLNDLTQNDAELALSWKSFGAQMQTETSCHEGKMQFHIDARGKLSLCSNNRRDTYDLTQGKFEEAFYQSLPHFYCGRKAASKESLKL